MSISFKILFNFSLNIGKPENSFNFSKNQEFKLISYIMSFLKSNLSKTHKEQSVESSSFKEFKVIASLPILHPYFRLFIYIWKKIYQKIL